jgi:hypothetical protein
VSKLATLYQLVNEIENFDFEIDPETGEILNADELDALELEKDVKVENICLYIKNLTSDAKAYKEEKDNFDKKMKAAEKKAESLKKYLQSMLNGEKFKSNKVTVSYRKTKAVDVLDVKYVPAEYLTITQEVKPDKKAIKEAIENGVEVAGCSLVERQSMSIK